VKANPDLRILQELQRLDCNFDCASPNEIDTILSLGMKANRIIYANPVRSVTAVQHALDKGVSLMTFDSLEEIYKFPYNKKSNDERKPLLKAFSQNTITPGIQRVIPQEEPGTETSFILRLKVDDTGSQCSLNKKFGVPLCEVESILKKSIFLGLLEVR